MAMHAVICIMNTDTVRGFPPEAAHNGEHPPMLIHLEQVCSSPAIYKLYIPLTGNALKNLNCYVLTDHGESLVIDTGFRNEECRTALMGGLKELGVSPEHTKLFLTHLHSDHCGLAEYFDYPDTTIYMGEAEYKRLQGIIANISANATWDSNAMLMAEGFPEEDLRTLVAVHGGRREPLHRLTGILVGPGAGLSCISRSRRSCSAATTCSSTSRRTSPAGPGCATPWAIT